MKESSKAALLLIVLYLSGAILCDLVLATNYKTTSLDDPLKNFEKMNVKPFAHLQIRGGNGYAVEIRQGEKYQVMLMNSRKSFFKMRASGDSLLITFNVANQTYQSPKKCVVGLIVTMPKLHNLVLSGTNNIIGPITGDTLSVQQDGKTFTRMHQVTVDEMKIAAGQESLFDFETNNITRNLVLDLKDKAGITMNGISFRSFQPVVRDSAQLVFYKKPFDMLRELMTNK